MMTSLWAVLKLSQIGNRMSFAFVKTVSALPADLVPNSIYVVRVGEGFDLYVTDLTGATAHKLNPPTPAKPLATVADLHYWIERTVNLIKSRGNGLVTNGSGMLGDNTNFKEYIFEPLELATGYGSFYTEKVNSSYPIDEPIAIDPNKTYEFSFYAKGLNTDGYVLGKSYAFVECLDMDLNSIQPQHCSQLNIKLIKGATAGGQVTLTLAPESIPAFTDYFNRHAKTSGNIFITTHSYKSAKGYQYPLGTYSRTFLSQSTKWNATTFNADTGEWTGITLNRNVTINDGDTIALSVAGGTFIYPIGRISSVELLSADHMIDAVVKSDWTYYCARFKPANLLRVGTALVKVGWLLNRHSNTQTKSRTYINCVSFKEV